MSVMHWARLAPLLWLIGAPSAAVPSIPPSQPVPLPATERLSYAIHWVGVPVGESTLAVKKMTEIEGDPAYHFAATTESYHVLRLVYPVNTRVDSYVDAERFLPIRYRMSGRQGFSTRDRELIFDHEQHSVMLREGRSRTYQTVSDVQDPLSALYYYRVTASLRDGEIVRVPVHDRKRPKEIIVTAGPVESVTTKAGTFQAARLKIWQEQEGLFLHDGDITLWMTADERRLPVRMEAKVAIGTVTAELTAFARGAAPPLSAASAAP
ncbi:MAG: DUF3108 domain-containing protein [Nitrospirota bacterium]